ncbi:MAG: hypothetical protein ACRDJE_09940, partial [Dehalococcoidia bacterium]
MWVGRREPSLGTNLARVYGLDWRGLALYLLMAGGLFAAYVLAVRAARMAPARAAAGVIVAGGVFSATLLPAHPTYSSDVFHYIATARVGFTHGDNPHVTPPAAFPEDPAMSLSGWNSLPSPYGAAWTWLSALPFVASDRADDPTRAMLAFKALAVLCAVGASAGVAVAAERLRPGTAAAAAVVFSWNPVVIVHLGADGHNDAAMLLFLAWGLAALAWERRALAVLLFGTAALVKPAAGIGLMILAGVLLRRGYTRQVALGLCVTALLGLVLYAPFWAGAETFRAMLDEGSYFTTTLGSLAERVLAPAPGDGPAEMVIGAVLRLALLGVAVWMVLRVPDRPSAIIAGAAIAYTLAVTVLATWYQPWYATWALVFLAPLAARGSGWLAAVLALTAGGLLVPVATNFAAQMSGRENDDLLIDVLGTALVLAPFIVLLPLLHTWTGRRGLTIGAPVSSPQ